MIDDLENQQNIARQRDELAKQWYADNQVDTMIGVFERIVNDFRQTRGATILPGVAHIRGEGTVEKLEAERVVA